MDWFPAMVALMVADLYFLVWPRQAKLVLSPNSVEFRQMAAFFGKEDFPTIMQPP